jgi:hypothetical protein
MTTDLGAGRTRAVIESRDAVIIYLTYPHRPRTTKPPRLQESSTKTTVMVSIKLLIGTREEYPELLVRGFP